MTDPTTTFERAAPQRRRGSLGALQSRSWLRGAGAWSLALLLAFTLQACREAEQDRPLRYEKGVYGGPEDEEIDEATRRELRERVKLQSFN
ncbi:MAG: hypothetical protein AAGM38_08240 [Pseudomonadota bacterium]